jgi:hypothetical protein
MERTMRSLDIRPPKTLLLQKKVLTFSEWQARDPQESDYDTLIDEPVLLYDAQHGGLELVYLELPDDASDVVQVLERTQFREDTRRNGLAMRSRIFGLQPRSLPRRDFCTAATLARDDPSGHAVVARYAETVARYYQHFNPEQYARHASLTERVLPEWRMQDEGVFTSGIINYNSALQYHFDAGNFKAVWSNMLVYRKEAEGGYLAIPEYDVAFKLPSNSLIMFDGQRLMHGVTPIYLQNTNAYRFSIVFYSLKQLWNCLPIDAEIARAQQRRTERELRRAGLKSVPA